MYFSRFVPISGILCLLLLSLSGCAYLIPENPSAPRYNQVIGEPHRPELNNRSLAPQSAASAPVPQVAQQEIAPPTMEAPMPPAPPAPVNESAMNLPPVDAATKAQAEQQIAMANLPPAVMPPLGQEARRVPTENMMPDAAMVANGYPDLNAVPPRPAMTGPDSTQSRLNEVRKELEEDRTHASEVKDQLGRDAAAEPSLLSTLPEGTVPPPAPVSVAPLTTPPVAPASVPNPAPVPAPQSLNAPAFIAPGPLMTPPSAMPPQAYAAPIPTSFQVAPPPPTQIAYNNAPEPILLRPPGDMQPRATMPAPAPVFAIPPSAGPAPAPMASGFDPMAGAAPAAVGPSSMVATMGYLPPSRYEQRRQ